MYIRNAAAEDVPQLIAIVSGLSHFFLPAGEDDLPEWLATTINTDQFLRRINNKNYINLVCESDGEVTGYISIKNKKHIYHLFVSPRYQRKGIARSLWKNAMILSASPIYTVRSSLYAVPVYESFGFVKSAPVEHKDKLLFQPMELKTQVL